MNESERPRFGDDESERFRHDVELSKKSPYALPELVFYSARRKAIHAGLATLCGVVPTVYFGTDPNTRGLALIAGVATGLTFLMAAYHGIRMYNARRQVPANSKFPFRRYNIDSELMDDL